VLLTDGLAQRLTNQVSHPNGMKIIQPGVARHELPQVSEP